MVVPLRPRQLLEAFDDVVAVAQAHERRARQLLQPPRARRLAQQRAHDAGGPRREQRAQRSRGRADVALAFFLDQDVLKGDVAVAGQIDVPKVVGLENPCALRRDIDRGGQGVCRRDLPPDVAQPRHGGPNLAWLSERADFSDQQVLLLAKSELHH